MDLESLKIHLKRYLILGSEQSVYCTGDRVSELKFRPTNLASVDGLVAMNQYDVMVKVVKEVVTSTNYDPVVTAYLLALWAKSDHDILRTEAYDLFPEALKTSKDLFLVFKFIKELLKCDKGKCWGAGSRKAISRWYEKKRLDQFQHILIGEKSYYGFCHKDLLSQSHFKSSNKELNSVIQHFVFGKEVELSEEWKKISSELKELKTTEDALKAAYLLSHLKLDPAFVPNQFQKSPEMWVDYVKALPILQLLSKLEYFTASKKLAAAVLPVVTTIINDCDGTDTNPAEIYAALKHYEVCANFLQKEKAIAKRRADAAAAEAEAAEATKKVEAAGSTKGTEKKPKGEVKTVGPKADKTVVDAVQALVDRSLKKLPPGDSSWAVGLHLTDAANATEIYRLPGVCPAGAVALTLQWLQRVGSVKSVVVSGDEDIKFDKDASVNDVTASVQKVKSDLNFSKCIKKATEDKIEVDVFLVISDMKGSWNAAITNGLEHLNEYRKALDRPQTRLIIVFLRCGRDINVPNDSGLFIVKGFDARVPVLIEEFGKGLF